MASRDGFVNLMVTLTAFLGATTITVVKDGGSFGTPPI